MYVVEDHGHTVTWGFCEPDVSWDYALENLGSEEATEVRGDLLGERGPVVVHRQEDAFDFKRWVHRAAQAHEGVE